MVFFCAWVGMAFSVALLLWDFFIVGEIFALGVGEKVGPTVALHVCGHRWGSFS